MKKGKNFYEVLEVFLIAAFKTLFAKGTPIRSRFIAIATIVVSLTILFLIYYFSAGFISLIIFK